ncbi:hypothetical protein DENSPDRAFT_346194 [Dentipellis sp. KUC8613]|nr:hypothetical protein DENSPDRAFT_346194 [Dentipellis sp. KUC8613]
MSSRSRDCDDSITVCSTSPEPPQTVSSPTSTNRRRRPSSRIAPSTGQRRRNDTRSRDDLATATAHNARLADEFYKMKHEWLAYPCDARPRSRREELQMLPALCNNFEAFDEQMKLLHGPQITLEYLHKVDSMHRKSNEEHQQFLQREEEVHQRLEGTIAEIAEGIKRYSKGVEEYHKAKDERIQRTTDYLQRADEYCQRVDANGQLLGKIVYGVNELSQGVRELNTVEAQRVRRMHGYGREGRNDK